MINKIYRPYSEDAEDIEVLRKYLRSLGYMHFKHTRDNITATDQRKGMRVQFTFEYTDDNDLERVICHIIIRRRTVRKHAPHRTEYQEIYVFRDDIAGWSVTPSHLWRNIGTSWHNYQNGLSWEQVVNTIVEILTTVEGDPTIPRNNFDGILTNLILAGLKAALQHAGHKDIVFESKAKTEKQYGSIVLRGAGQYRSIVVSLKSGRLDIGFGQNGVQRTVMIPCYEDPKFDPDLLVEPTLRAVVEMQRLSVLSDKFKEQCNKAFASVQQDFYDSMNKAPK